MKLHLKKSFLFLILSALAFPAAAQKEITFDSKPSSEGHHKSFSSGEGVNSVSVGVLSWFNGYVPFYYERRFMDMLSVQAGAGFTMRSFGGDLSYALESFGDNDKNFSGEYMYDVADDYTHYQYRNAKPGLYLSLAPKVYYQNECMDGMWLAPMIEYKNFRFDAQKADETAPVNQNTQGDDRLIPHTTDVMKEYINCMDFSLNWGASYQKRNHFTIGWSIGFGIRTSKGERLDIGVYNEPTGVEHYVNKIAQYDKTKPFLSFNLTLGGWF